MHLMVPYKNSLHRKSNASSCFGFCPVYRALETFDLKLVHFPKVEQAYSKAHRDTFFTYVPMLF